MIKAIFKRIMAAALGAIMLMAPGVAMADPGPNYQTQSFGTEGCLVTYGPLLGGYDVTGMIELATANGAYGFVMYESTGTSHLITEPYPESCRPPATPGVTLYLATGPIFDYEEKDFGFNGCHVVFGDLLEDTDLDAMVRAARQQNAIGFTLQSELHYGKVILGAYPETCKSDKGLSWPLYLAKGAMADYKRQDFGFDGCDVTFGPLITDTNRTAMNVTANEAGAVGYTFQQELKYGKILIGSYPSGCKSPSGMSWPLYLQ